MFNNLINRHDGLRLVQKIARGKGRRIAVKLISRKKKRVVHAWREVDRSPVHWGEIPAVRKRWNLLISGDPNVDYQEYFAGKYLAPKKGLLGLSLGCGRGDLELRWVEEADFQRIDAYDLSEERIEYARRQARERKMNRVLRFHVGDIHNIQCAANTYDLVITEGSLHHFSPLEEVLHKIHGCLKSDGYFFFNEFVGPSRFQWEKRQLELVNAVLTLLPVRYREIRGTRRVKKKEYRPGRLWMRFSDPSEAVESAQILPLVKRYFEIIEWKGFGGTVLNLLFSEIAHNFLSDDEETRRWLHLCFEIEDALLASNEIPSDYVMGMCKKRKDL